MAEKGVTCVNVVDCMGKADLLIVKKTEHLALFAVSPAIQIKEGLRLGVAQVRIDK